MDLFIMKHAVGVLHAAVMDSGNGNRNDIKTLCEKYVKSLKDVTSDQADKILEQCFAVVDKTAVH